MGPWAVVQSYDPVVVEMLESTEMIQQMQSCCDWEVVEVYRKDHVDIAGQAQWSKAVAMGLHKVVVVAEHNDVDSLDRQVALVQLCTDQVGHLLHSRNLLVAE